MKTDVPKAVTQSVLHHLSFFRVGFIVGRDFIYRFKAVKVKWSVIKLKNQFVLTFFILLFTKQHFVSIYIYQVRLGGQMPFKLFTGFFNNYFLSLCCSIVIDINEQRNLKQA